MKPPEGLEDEEGGESIDPQGVHFSTDSALSSAMNSSQLAVIENLITDSNSNSVLEDGFCWHIEKLDNLEKIQTIPASWILPVWLAGVQRAMFITES